MNRRVRDKLHLLAAGFGAFLTLCGALLVPGIDPGRYDDDWTAEQRAAWQSAMTKRRIRGGVLLAIGLSILIGSTFANRRLEKE
ncbi:MAG: hypothetical protein HY720_17875 [Planctomycetes bacterium]|nr:hypothetical protein [Planctomycetota bacterium]